MRADQLLVERGLAASRSQAQRLIAAGGRWRAREGWRTLVKSDDLPVDAEIELLDVAEARYVSRGGLKLEGALQAAGLDVMGRHGLDVGQSTGGFTDCLLLQGATSVVGVDVGHAQLHPKLRQDGRVHCIEGVNARELSAAVLLDHGSPVTRFDLVTGDLSFISLTLVLPALVPLMAPGADLLMLVKPQFELQPGLLGKGGIVRDPALYPQIEQKLNRACSEAGLAVKGWFDSPISGGDGNREFFIHAASAASTSNSSS